MKTKLTLTVQKDIIEKAKKEAKDRGISLSQLFEDLFDKKELKPKKTEEQKAARRLLDLLEKSEPTQASTKSDKEIIAEHLIKKYG